MSSTTSGKIALVTGAGTGIGKHAALALSREGYSVALAGRRKDRLEETAAAAKGPTLVVPTDVGDPASVKALFAKTLEAFGRLDVLFNNAGTGAPPVPLEDLTYEQWRTVVDINLTGVFLCNKTLAPHMKVNDYGRIVNIASIAGKEGNPNASHYSASKAGLIALTKSLGKELARTGIRVNCVTPAAVRTAIFDQITQQHIDFMLSKIPMGRFGTVDEIASLVAWLASEDCSFSTGAVFDLSGGRATY